jgi:biotin operon repressor
MLKVTFYTYTYQDWESCMRADRLLILLLLLQTRGSVTAQTLAKRLEVSERTIYRDLEALSLAGVPVYAERGPGGGWKLLEDYRTNLTRLTETEVTTPHGYKPGASGMTRVCRPTPIKASSRIFLLPLWSRPRIRPQWGHS